MRKGKMRILLGMFLILGLAACGRAPDPAPPKKLDQAEITSVARAYVQEHHPEVDLNTASILVFQTHEGAGDWDFRLTRYTTEGSGPSQKEVVARFLDPGFTLKIKSDGTVVETKD